MLTSIKIMIRKKYRIILSFLTSQQRSNVALIKVEQQKREREGEREGERGREREREGERGREREHYNEQLQIQKNQLN